MKLPKRMPAALVAALALFAFAPSVHAELDSANAVDPLIQQFQSASRGWALAITATASNVFWILALISLVVTLGMLILRGTEMGEVVAALVRFVLFTGIAYWVLSNGPEFSHDIISSFTELGTRAAGTGKAFSPTMFLDVSFSLYKKIIANEHWYQPTAAVSAEILGILIVLCACWMTINIILVLCSSWVLSSAGVIFLALGASVWGRDISWNFWRTVIAVGARLMVMVLVMNLGYRFLQQTVALLTVSPNGGELIVLLAASVVLAALSHSLPNLVGSVVGGHGAHGIGNLGMGVGVGAVMATGAALLREADRVNNRSERHDTRLQEAIRAAERLANGSGGNGSTNGNGSNGNGNSTPTQTVNQTRP